jgi:hypothetical protein
MKNLTYKAQSTPRQVIKKLESPFKSNGVFNFNVDPEATAFEIRKTVRYPDQILHRNRRTVQG